MRQLSVAQAFLYALLAFVGGVIIQILFSFPFLTALFGSAGGVFLLLFSGRKKVVVVMGIAVLFISLGMARTEFAQKQSERSELLALNGQEREFVFEGYVTAEPRNTGKTIQIVVAPETISQGRVLISTNDSQIQYGDKIRVQGVFQTPVEFEDFSYKEFLRNQGIYSVMYLPEVVLVQESGPSGFSMVLEMKDAFRNTLHRFVSSSRAEILGAIVLGDKYALSDSLKEKLNVAGVRHITAISGMHVAILAGILLAFFLGIGLWRHQAIYATLALIILFIVLTGFQASAIRAGIMGGVLLIGQILGRPAVSERALVYAAAVMLGINPFLVKDMGFQLSFLAVLGIITLLPLIRNKLSLVPEKFGARDILAMTFAAQIFTFPILVSNFGYFSIVSPITNFLVVPALPFVLAFGFLFLIGGTLFAPFGLLLSFPVRFLLDYMNIVIELFSKVPFAAPNVPSFFAWAVLLLYVPLIWFVWRRRRNRRFQPYE